MKITKLFDRLNAGEHASRALRITGVILTMAVVTFIIFMTMIFIIGTAFS